MDFDRLRRTPMVVVIKGRVSTAATALAKELAKTLLCTLVSFNDVFPCIAAAHKDAAAAISNDIVLRLASDDISGRFPGWQRVVVDLSLPQQLRLDQVLETTRIKTLGSKVFVLDCRPSDDESDAAGNESDDAPHLLVDISSSMKTVEELVADVCMWILSSLRNSVTRNIEREAKDEYEQDWKHNIWPVFGHCHPLAMTEVPSGISGTSCRLCCEDVSGPAHGCSDCGFFLHTSCFELPRELDFPHHDQKKISLRHIPPQSRGCILCRSPSGVLYNCGECFVQLHPKCADLPAVIKHSCHEHDLNFYIFPFFLKSRMQYICHACGNYGSATSYFCKECRLHLHVDCALRLERSVLHKRHWHPLVLSPPPKDETHEYYCEVCAEPRHESLWIYYCAECEYEAHISCINPDVPPCHADVYLPEYKTEEELKELNDLVYDDIKNVPGELGPRLAEISPTQAAWTPVIENR